MYKLINSLVVLCATVSVSNAAEWTSVDPNNGWYAGVSGSVLWSNLPSSMSVNNGASCVASLNKDVYSVKKGTDTAFSVNAGYQWQNERQWFSGYALGLRYQHFYMKSIKGTVTQYALPQFLNYNYTWDLGSDLIALASKIDITRYGSFTPFIDLGLGLALNHTGTFSEMAVAGVTPRISPRFGGQRQRNFAYNLGLGLAFDLLPQCSLSLVYDYQALGGLRSTKGESTWSGEHLDLGSYKANMLSLGLTYHFDQAAAPRE